jgi:hypothetical protein
MLSELNRVGHPMMSSQTKRSAIPKRVSHPNYEQQCTPHYSLVNIESRFVCPNPYLLSTDGKIPSLNPSLFVSSDHSGRGARNELYIEGYLPWVSYSA